MTYCGTSISPRLCEQIFIRNLLSISMQPVGSVSVQNLNWYTLHHFFPSAPAPAPGPRALQCPWPPSLRHTFASSNFLHLLLLVCGLPALDTPLLPHTSRICFSLLGPLSLLSLLLSLFFSADFELSLYSPVGMRLSSEEEGLLIFLRLSASYSSQVLLELFCACQQLVDDENFPLLPVVLSPPERWNQLDFRGGVGTSKTFLSS